MEGQGASTGSVQRFGLISGPDGVCAANNGVVTAIPAHSDRMEAQSRAEAYDALINLLSYWACLGVKVRQPRSLFELPQKLGLQVETLLRLMSTSKFESMSEIFNRLNRIKNQCLVLDAIPSVDRSVISRAMHGDIKAAVLSYKCAGFL